MGDGATRIAMLGTGHHVPERVLTNQDLERMVDTSDEWIVERTGIRERHIASSEEATSDVCVPAAQRAMEDAGVDATDLDTIICATVTADNVFPSLACKLQARLGATNAYAFDLAAACSGWIYSLYMGQSLIRGGSARHVLVIGAECLSKIVNWQDRSTCVLFGDGAGATVLGPSSGDAGILSCCLASDGNHYDLLHQPAGGSRLPASAATVEDRLHSIHMNGNEVFRFAVRNMVKLAKRAADEAGVRMEELDLLIPHQANRRIIDQTAKRLGCDADRVYVNVDRFGNTSAASIPIALDEARRAGRIGPGSTVGVVAFGGGFTYGAAIVRF